MDEATLTLVGGGVCRTPPARDAAITCSSYFDADVCAIA